jgi:hypothetical protein
MGVLARALIFMGASVFLGEVHAELTRTWTEEVRLHDGRTPSEAVRNDKRLVGIVALGDIAVEGGGTRRPAARALSAISEPA